MTHAIGERFEVDHIIYEVRQSDTCKECSLYIEGKCKCLDQRERFGHCFGGLRKDKQNVKFVQVGESNQITLMSYETF